MAARLRIREQLCLLISFACILAIVVLAVTTWFQSRRYLQQSREDLLGTVANVKAAQISQNVALINDAVQSVSTRDQLQQAITDYNNGNQTQGLLDEMETNLGHALSGGADQPLVLQAVVYPLPKSNSTSAFQPIVSVTAESITGQIQLPYLSPNGSAIYLGQDDGGYPAMLLPNFTSIDYANNGTVIYYGNRPIYYDTTIVFGPLVLTGNQSLISMTLAINNNTTRGDVLGYLTATINASYLYDTVESRVGLGKTGEIVLVRPDNADNLLTTAIDSSTEDGNVLVSFVLPPNNNTHPTRAKDSYLTFELKEYPAVWLAYQENASNIYDIGVVMSTHNEEGVSISAGYAKVPSDIVDWALVFEQSRSEVNRPIDHLRDTYLICAFSVLAGILVICFPLAHYAVRPIIALRKATRATVITYEAPLDAEEPENDTEKGDGDNTLFASVDDHQNRRKLSQQKVREFHIPEKVPEKRHLVYDELTDLTSTFNDMSGELAIQYARLEERVRMRTVELEKSRNEAYAANESKTLFIANVSHELRTPLNGVIGMCAVAMQEEDVDRVRQSLKIIYKSSDLLLHLLNDVLTFSSSSTSYGQGLAIEEDYFRLGDIATQLVSIFEKKAVESNVSLRVLFVGANPTIRTDTEQAVPEDEIVAKSDPSSLQKVRTEDYARGPIGTGPLRTIGFRGDQHRLLQILMNLVSNSLKFTPANGAVEVRIKFKDLIEYDVASEMATPEVMPSSAVREPNPEISQNEISYMASNEHLRTMRFDFEVEDTGMGIPEHLQQEIFKPFVQADAALSKKFGGTGLGLAICAQLAELMGGSMSVKSTVGIGSTFTLSLPLQYTKEVVPSISGSLAPSLRRGSVASSKRREETSVRSTRTPNGRNGRRSAKTSIYSQETGKANLTPRWRDVFEQRSVRWDDKKTDEPAQDQRCLSVHRMTSYNSHTRLETIQSVQHHRSPTEIEQGQTLLPPTPETLKKTERLVSPGLESVTKTEKPKSPKSNVKSKTKADPRKILVAEDNAVNQQVILRLLKLEGISNIILAEDGVQALDAVKASLAEVETGSDDFQPISLILMDVQMPNMDGIESTKEIRASGFTGPIVALTAYDHDTNRTACKDAGMNDFLGKPIKRPILRKTLEEFKDAPKSQDDEEAMESVDLAESEKSPYRE